MSDSDSQGARRLACLTQHLLASKGCIRRTAVEPRATSGAAAPRILEGVKVIEMATVIAGPTCAAFLADLGADVIKIERPGDFDVSRSWGGADHPDHTASPELFEKKQGGSSFTQFNRGKRAISLDVQKPEGQRILKKMLEQVDVFVTNVRGRGLKKIGLDYESLASEFPRLIYAHVSAWGRAGPMVDNPGFDVGSWWAHSGVMELARPSDSSPMPRQVGGIGDSVLAVQLAGFIGTALYYRERTGRGQLLDASLMRSGLTAMQHPLAAFAGKNQFTTGFAGEESGGMGYIRESTIPGERRTTLSYVPYRLKCGRWIHMMDLVPDRLNPKLFKMLGMTPDDFFGPKEKRTKDGEHLRKATSVLDAQLAQKSYEEWKPLFDQHDIWHAKVNKFEEMWDDEQANAVDAFVTAPGVRHRLVGLPILMSAHKAEPQGRAPLVAEHSSGVLKEFGFTAADEAEFRKNGIVE